MRFMMLVKSGEKKGLPTKELMDAIAKLAEDSNKAGTMIATGGLAPTSMSTRVRVSRGQLTTTDGPFTEAKEVVGGDGGLWVETKKETNEGGKPLLGLSKKKLPG